MSMNQKLNWIVIMIITNMVQIMMRSSQSMKIAKMMVMKGMTRLKETAVPPHESLVNPQCEQEEVNPPVKSEKE